MSDDLKPSRLLLRLEAEIAGARTQLDADCKRAERAACLARLTRLGEARSEIVELQERNGRNPKIELSIWVNLAEGLVAYFDNVGVNTTDRVRRAHALSVAARQMPMWALCAAWLAQLAYSILDMDALARHVREALSIAETSNHAARSRACLVVAQALHLAGRADLATAWYERSRFHASIDGDDLTISALMHNMAWLRMLTIRQVVLFDKREGDPKALATALTNAESTDGFDKMRGDQSWQDLKPILRAQIVSLQGDAGGAVALYEQHLASAGAPSRLQSNLLADKAWCHVQLGHEREARSCVELALASLIDETQIDDLAASHSRLSQVFGKLHDTIRQNHHANAADEAWGTHRRLQAQAIGLLEDMDDRGNARPIDRRPA